MPPSRVEDIPPTFFEKHKDFKTKTFDVFQTWTEYVNRLIGAATGLLMFATALLSLGFWRVDRRIVGLSVLAMLLTGFEAWLGKLVVDKNLEGGMVTTHLLVAVLIMALLILANYLVAARHRLTGAAAPAGSNALAWIGSGVLALTLVQVVIGTQVREGVDVMAGALGPMKRDGWLAPSAIYTVHKFLWMVVAAAMVVWLQRVWQQLSANAMVRKLIYGLAAAVVMEVVLGTVLAYQDLPPAVQPLHMLFANLILAAEFSIWIHVLGTQRLFSRRMKDNALQDSALNNAR